MLQASWIQNIKTGDQLYSDTSPNGEFFLVSLKFKDRWQNKWNVHA